jgi:hypothetical protein
MNTPKYVAVVIAFLIGAWFTFDGTRALTVGDYVTPQTGPRAGQLGPWSRIVSTLGLDPRGRTMKCIHVALGVAWLISMLLFLFRPSFGWWGLLATSLLSLWYLPIGTVLSLAELGLLLLTQLRNLK